MGGLFWYSNLHFIVGILIAVSSFSLCWLLFDAFLVTKKKTALLQSLGFCAITVGILYDAISFSALYQAFWYQFFYFGGLLCLFASFFIDRPIVPRYPFSAIMPIGTVSVSFAWTEVVLVGAVAVFSFYHLIAKYNKSLRFFAFGFLILTLTSVFSALNAELYQENFWIIGQVGRLLAFSLLFVWGWQYLQLRVQELRLFKLLLGMMMISVVLSFAFANIVAKRAIVSTKTRLLNQSSVIVEQVVEELSPREIGELIKTGIWQTLRQELQSRSGFEIFFMSANNLRGIDVNLSKGDSVGETEMREISLGEIDYIAALTPVMVDDKMNWLVVGQTFDQLIFPMKNTRGYYFLLASVLVLVALSPFFNKLSLE